MGIGLGLAALLQGAGRGFAQAEREDKLKKAEEKAAGEARFNKVATELFKDTSQSPEIRRIAGSAAAGNKDAIKQLQDGLSQGVITVPTPARTAPALPAAAELTELPSVALTDEGTVKRDQIVSPPPPTQEARERQIQIEPGTEEIPLFRDPRDIAREAGELQALAQRPVEEQTLQLREEAEIRREQREQDRIDTELSQSVGRAEELLEQMISDELITSPQRSLVIGQLKDRVPFHTALKTAGVDIGAGQTFANKVSSINTTLRAAGGAPLTDVEIRRIAGAASVSSDQSRIYTQRVGNSLVGTVYDPDTGKFTSHIIRQFAEPRTTIGQADVEEAKTAMIAVMGQKQWDLLGQQRQDLNVENYLESLRLGQVPRYGREVQSVEGIFDRTMGLFGLGFADIRPTEVLPPLDLTPLDEEAEFRRNNPR